MASRIRDCGARKAWTELTEDHAVCKRKKLIFAFPCRNFQQGYTTGMSIQERPTMLPTETSKLRRSARYLYRNNLYVALLLLLANPQLFSQTYTLTGTGRSLREMTNNPTLANAIVKVDDVMVGRTDANGAYTITNIPTGTHTIKIAAPGHKEVQFTKDFSGNLNINFSLVPLKYATSTGDSLEIDMNHGKQLFPEGGIIGGREPVYWRSLPVKVFLSGANSADSATTKAALGNGDGNWQNAQASSVEKKMKRNLYEFTTDSVAARNNGIVIKYNQPSNSTSPFTDPLDRRYLRFAICNIQRPAGLAETQHEVEGFGRGKGYVGPWLSNMNISGHTPFTPEDEVLSALSDNHRRAKERGEQDIFWHDIQNTTSAVREYTSTTPETFVMYQNYPNPFNPTTSIVYSLPRAANVTLSVFNPLGQNIATLVREQQDAGTYRQMWSADGIASGVYYYRLQAGEFVATRKVVLLR